VNIVSAGYVGVGLFFLLSGFILAYSHSDIVNEGREALRFWQARFARIYPDYLLALALATPLALQTVGEFGSTRVGASGVAAVLLLQAWHPWSAGIWNFPGWSLSAEAFFYAVFPWAMSRIRRMGELYAWMAGCWLLALAAPLAYLVTDPDGLGSSLDTSSRAPYIVALMTLPLFQLPAFLFGALLGSLFVRRGGTRAVGPGTALSVAGVAGTLVVLFLSNHIPLPLLHNGLLLPCFGLLIYGLALGGGPIAWVLSRPAIVRLGEASYAMYIFQHPVRHYAWAAAYGLSRRMHLLVRASIIEIASWITVVIASLVVLEWFERPTRRLLLTFFSRRVSASSPMARPKIADP
jgi:peptidoglycan/LPS O-acetylase OafA/YrhL